jgi:hypothetical protein
MSLQQLQSLNQPWGMPSVDPSTIGANVNMQVIGPNGSVDWNTGSTYGGGVQGGLQAISGYRPWGSGLPAGAGFGTKLGSWLGGNGAMLGGVANLASQGLGAYLGLQQLSMAKKQMAREWKATNANFENQADSYRTAMNDRLTGRYYATEEERQAAMKDAELSNTTLKG